MTALYSTAVAVNWSKKLRVKISEFICSLFKDVVFNPRLRCNRVKPSARLTEKCMVRGLKRCSPN